MALITKQQLFEMKQAAAHQLPADLVIKNVQLVNVVTQEIHRADIAVKDGYVVGFCGDKAAKVIDGTDYYLAPLLTDSHIHIESTMLTPGQLNDILLPKGIGTIVADPHEIANVAGKDGIDYMLSTLDDLDLEIKIVLPSCVPSTNLEDSGARLTAKDLKPYYKNRHVLGLAEVMDYPAVLHDDDMLTKVYDALEAGRTCDGHGAVLDNIGLDVYGTIRIKNDHECGDANGMKERLRRGIYTFIREGSVTKNLKDLIGSIDRYNYRYACLCTDDSHPDDLIKNGGVDNAVREAIKCGIDPIIAITMATLNAAECYHFPARGCIAPGKRADFFLFKDLKDIRALQVYRKGVLVAKNGKIINPKKDVVSSLTKKVKSSVNYGRINADKLQIHMGKARKMRLIRVEAGNVVTFESIETVKKDKNDNFIPDVNADQLKIAVVERHHALGKVGLAGVKGFGLQSGAIATTVAHDSHNLIVIGTNDKDMLEAMRQCKLMGGGYIYVKEGKVIASVPLTIGGLMSEADIKDIVSQLNKIHEAVSENSRRLTFNPFMMLSFISLPVIPELKLTDQGLVDVRHFCFVSPIVTRE